MRFDLRTIPSLAFAAAVFAGTAVITAAQTITVVRIPAEIVTEADRISLAKIAAISGDAAAAERIGRVSLGYAPNIGSSREVRREQIVLAVKAAGFLDKDFKIDAPASIVIRRSGQTLDPAIVRSAVETALLANLRAENVDAKLVRIDVPFGLQVPAGRIDVRVNGETVRNIFAPFSVPVEIRIDRRLVRTLSVSAEVEAAAEVLVAARDLPAGTALAPPDLRSEKVRIDKPVGQYVRDSRIVHGFGLVREMRAGSPLTRDSLAGIPVVKLGDTVRVEAVSGKMKIVVDGEARAAGRIGDQITVKNLQTGALLQAVVVDRAIVRVAF